MAEISKARLDRYRRELVASAKPASSTNFEKVTFFKPQRDTLQRIRVLPGIDPDDPDLDFYVPVRIHFNASPTVTSITCPKNEGNEKECPVCKRVDMLFKTGNPQDLEQARKMKAQTKYVMSVLLLDGPQAGEMTVWFGPATVKDSIISWINDPEIGDLLDPAEGLDLKLVVTGVGFGTSYKVDHAMTRTSISDDEDELNQFLDSRPKLYKAKRADTPDNIRKAMQGEVNMLAQGFYAQRDEDSSVKAVEEVKEIDKVPFEAPVEEAKPKLKLGVAKPVSKPEPTVAEEPEPSEEEEPEETPAPVKPKFSVSKPKLDVSAITAQVNRIKLQKK